MMMMMMIRYADASGNTSIEAACSMAHVSAAEAAYGKSAQGYVQFTLLELYITDTWNGLHSIQTLGDRIMAERDKRLLSDKIRDRSRGCQPT
jgi:hypothetical protein